MQGDFAERFERIRLLLVNRLPHGAKQVIAGRIPRPVDTSQKTIQERVSRELNGERDLHIATVLVSRDYFAEVGDTETADQINLEMGNGPAALPIQDGKLFRVFGRKGQLFLGYDR